MNTKNTGRDKSRTSRTNSSTKKTKVGDAFKPKKKEASPFSKGPKKMALKQVNQLQLEDV